MSLQDIMRPNTLPLFINGVGPGPGTQNLTFDTLTQNNGNSSIDLNGNLEAGDLQVNGSADITGSLQANFIETADMEVSGGIISTKVTSPEFTGVQFSGAQAVFGNILGVQGEIGNLNVGVLAADIINSNSINTDTLTATGSVYATAIGAASNIISPQFAGAQGSFDILLSRKGLLNKGVLLTGSQGDNNLTPEQIINGNIYYDNTDGDANFILPSSMDSISYLNSLGILNLTGYYFETNFFFYLMGSSTFNIFINPTTTPIIGPSIGYILINNSKYRDGPVAYSAVGVRILTYFTSNSTAVLIPFVCPYIL